MKFKAISSSSCPSLAACVASLLLSAGAASAQSGSTTWNGSVDGDFFNVSNWDAAQWPNGNATFAGTANTTVTHTASSGESPYVYQLLFTNSTTGAFTIGGAQQFNWGGPGIVTTAMTSGSLTDEISVLLVFVGTANKTVTTGADHDLLFSGGMSGGGGGFTFAKAGVGTLTLTGNNTFTAPITVSGGVLQLGDGGTGGSLNVANAIEINSGASLVINQSDTVTQGVDFGGVLSGDGGLTQAGSGTTVLNGASVHAGPTQVTGGVLSLTMAALGDTSTVTVSGGVLDLDFAGTDTIAVLDLGSGPVANGEWGSLVSGAPNTDASLTGTGTLTVVGPPATVVWDASTDATWTAPDATSWSGASYKDNDLAEFNGAGAGTVTISGTVAPGSVVVNSAAAVDYTIVGDAIGGAATISKSGASRLFLNGANTYTGVTTINGGQIRINNNDALGSTVGGTIISGSTKLELTGGITIAEPITNQGDGNGKLTSTSGTNTLTGLVTLENRMDVRGSNFVFQGGFTSANNSGVGFNGSNYIVEITPLTLGTGDFGVTSAGNNAGNATELNVGGNDWGLTTINFGGYLKVGGADYMPTDTQVRFGFNQWDRSSGTLDLNGSNQTVRALGHFQLGLGSDNTVTGMIGDVLTVNLDSGSTLSTYEGRFEGGLSVVKEGDGVLTLENLSSTVAPAVAADPSPGPAVPSTNTGSFTINDGSVVSRAGYGASDAVNFSDAVRLIVASGTSLELDYTGTDIIGALDLAGSGFLPDGVYDSTHPSGVITGTGSLTVVGANLLTQWDGSTDMTWTAPDATSWSGDLYSDGQEVSFSDLGAGTVTVSGGVAPGGITVNNTSGNDFTFAGDAITGATGLSKLGDGGLALTGVNTFTGSIAVDGGTLLIDGAGLLEGGAYAGDLTISNLASFEYSSTASQVITGLVSGAGSGGVIKSDSGTLDILMKSGTYSGPTTVNGGTLRFTNEADLRNVGTSDFAINGGVLEFQSSVGGANRTVLNNKVFTFGPAGGGTLNFNGGNHLFQGFSSHSIVTTGGAQNTISSTSGGFMNMQTAGTIVFDVADGTDAVDLNLSATFSNGLITKNGDGTLAITGGHGGSYPIVINAGTLEVGGSATLAGGTFTQTITNDSVFRYNSSAAQTISGVVSGTGSLVKDGGGTLTLSASNSYSGDTTVGAGILSLGDGASASGLDDASDLTVETGAVVDLNYVGTDTVDELFLGGNPQAAGTWGATGSGATFINDVFFTGTGTITVTTGGGAFSDWAALTGATVDPNANDDADTLNNLLEFAFGTDPLVSDGVPLDVSGPTAGTPTTSITYGPLDFAAQFVRRTDGSATYTVQFSNDLSTWEDSAEVPTFVASINSDYEIVEVSYPIILANGKKANFFRVSVELN